MWTCLWLELKSHSVLSHWSCYSSCLQIIHTLAPHAKSIPQPDTVAWCYESRLHLGLPHLSRGVECDFYGRWSWAGPEVLLATQWGHLFAQGIDAGLASLPSSCVLWGGKVEMANVSWWAEHSLVAVLSCQFFLQCFPLCSHRLSVIRMVKILLLGLKRDQIFPISIWQSVLCVCF